MSHYTIHQDDDTSKPVHTYRWSLLKDGNTIGELYSQADAETIRAALNGVNEAKGLVALWCADATADEAGIPEAEEQRLWVTAGILRARAGQRRIDAAELKAALLSPSLPPQLPDAPHFIKVIQLLIAEMRASRFEPVRLCADQLQAAISQQDTGPADSRTGAIDMRFRKKPVVIDAEQWNGTIECAQSIVAWLQHHGTQASVSPGWQRVDRINIPTLEGVMTAQPNDWIIRGVKGEFYPCKPDIFAATYEPANGSDY